MECRYEYAGASWGERFCPHCGSDECDTERCQERREREAEAACAEEEAAVAVNA